MHEQLIERLFSDSESRAIASEFAKECSRTGITDNRVEALLNESAVLAQRAAKGEFDPTNTRSYMESFAEVLGVERHHIDSASKWFGSVPDSTPAPAAETLAEAASADAADDATITKAEAALRADNGRAYWTDSALRENYASAMARREAARQAHLDAAHAPAPQPAPQAAPGPSAAPQAPPVDRRAELVELMGDQRSAYWRGPQAEAMQQEFRNLVVPAEAPASAPAAAA
jgi:hypothetical protein